LFRDHFKLYFSEIERICFRYREEPLVGNVTDVRDHQYIFTVFHVFDFEIPGLVCLCKADQWWVFCREELDGSRWDADTGSVADNAFDG